MEPPVLFGLFFDRFFNLLIYHSCVCIDVFRRKVPKWFAQKQFVVGIVSTSVVRKNDDRGVIDFGQARRCGDSGCRLAEKGGENGMLSAVILIRAVPDSASLFQACNDRPDIFAFDCAGIIPLTPPRHDSLEQCVFVSTVHDIERDLFRQSCTTKIQGRQVHAEKNDTVAAFQGRTQVIKAVDLYQMLKFTGVAKPRKRCLDNADAAGAKYVFCQSCSCRRGLFGKTES